jgi:hypothetical protein
MLEHVYGCIVRIAIEALECLKTYLTISPKLLGFQRDDKMKLLMVC